MKGQRGRAQQKWIIHKSLERAQSNCLHFCFKLLCRKIGPNNYYYNAKPSCRSAVMVHTYWKWNRISHFHVTVTLHSAFNAITQQTTLTTTLPQRNAQADLSHRSTSIAEWLMNDAVWLVRLWHLRLLWRLHGKTRQHHDFWHTIWIKRTVTRPAKTPLSLENCEWSVPRPAFSWPGSRDSLSVRVPASWSKRREFESRQERWENFSSPESTLCADSYSVSVLPPCYRGGT